jgi:predicted small secreted protein
MKTSASVALVVVAALSLAGCTTTQRTMSGAALGGAAGAVVGGAVGGYGGAVVGAAAGGAGGALLANQ